MHHHQTEENADSEQDMTESYYIPRKFVFEYPSEETKHREMRTEVQAIKRSLEAERLMPFIFTFPEPSDYKESYSQLVKNIIAMYNHVRLLIIEKYYGQLKDFTKDIRIERVSDCLTMLREVFNGCCEKLSEREDTQASTNVAESAKSYEDLLQKAEAKIRIFIRNEQIFRLNFDILMQKCEDSEKMYEEQKAEIDAMKKTQEALVKENLKLSTKLQLKETELKKAKSTLGSALERKHKEIVSHAGHAEPTDNSIVVIDQNKTIDWNQQMLKMVLNENKFAGGDSSNRLTPSLDGKSSMEYIRQSISKAQAPAPAKAKPEKAHTPLNTSSVNTSVTQHRKQKSTDRIKNSLIAEYKKKLMPARSVLNASLDKVLNRSAENSQERHSGKRSDASRKNSQVIKKDVKHDIMKSKSPPKERKTEGKSDRDPSPSIIAIMNRSFVAKTKHSDKYSNLSRPISSNRKARDSPVKHKTRVVQTEQSPESKSKSQDSKVFYVQANPHNMTQSSETYTKMSKKRQSESREGKVQNKEINRSASLIKSMIAEQLTKKISQKASIK